MGKYDDSTGLGGGVPASLEDESGIPLSAGKKNSAARVSKNPTSETTTKGLSKRRRFEEDSSDEEDEEEEQNGFSKPFKKR